MYSHCSWRASSAARARFWPLAHPAAAVVAAPRLRSAAREAHHYSCGRRRSVGVGRCNDDKKFCRGVSISLLDRVQLDPRACGQLRASLCQVSEKMKNKLAAESEAPLRLPLLYASAVLFGKVRNKMAQMAQAGGCLLGFCSRKRCKVTASLPEGGTNGRRSPFAARPRARYRSMLAGTGARAGLSARACIASSEWQCFCALAGEHRRSHHHTQIGSRGIKGATGRSCRDVCRRLCVHVGG